MNESTSDRMARALPNFVLGLAPLALAWFMAERFPSTEYLLALALGVLIAIATRVRYVRQIRQRAAQGLPPPDRALNRWQLGLVAVGLVLYLVLLPTNPSLSVWENPWLLGIALGYLIALQLGNAIVNYRGGIT